VLTVTRQCQLLKLPRSTVYHKPKVRDTSVDEIIMRILDRLHTQHPAMGSRQLRDQLRRQGHIVNRKRVQRLMHLMGLECIYPHSNTSEPHPEHRKFPYRLRGLAITRPDQVWAADITYIPMQRGFVYLVVVMDWYSRDVLSWKLSSTLDSDFCVEALREALEKHQQPDIFNTDQGSQFTSDDFLKVLEDKHITISMDGRGRWQDNVFVERLWRTVKYEEVYLKAYESPKQARESLACYFEFYNHVRTHQALNHQTPWEVYAQALIPLAA
jgi:putative transposase